MQILEVDHNISKFEGNSVLAEMAVLTNLIL